MTPHYTHMKTFLGCAKKLCDMIDSDEALDGLTYVLDRSTNYSTLPRAFVDAENNLILGNPKFSYKGEPADTFRYGNPLDEHQFILWLNSGHCDVFDDKGNFVFTGEPL